MNPILVSKQGFWHEFRGTFNLSDGEVRLHQKDKQEPDRSYSPNMSPVTIKPSKPIGPASVAGPFFLWGYGEVLVPLGGNRKLHESIVARCACER